MAETGNKSTATSKRELIEKRFDDYKDFIESNTTDKRILEKLSVLTNKLQILKERPDRLHQMKLRPIEHSPNQYKKGNIFSKYCELVYVIPDKRKTQKHNNNTRHKMKTPKLNENAENVTLTEDSCSSDQNQTLSKSTLGSTVKKRKLYSPTSWLESDKYLEDLDTE